MHNSQCTMHNSQCIIHNAQFVIHNYEKQDELAKVAFGALLHIAAHHTDSVRAWHIRHVCDAKG